MADEIKVANQLTLTWGDYPGSYDMPNVVIKFNSRRERRAWTLERCKENSIQPAIAAFEGE